jgi:hypothetical protein
MKTAVVERLEVPEVKIDWEQIQKDAQAEPAAPVQPVEETKDAYWKDYNEFLVNLA